MHDSIRRHEAAARLLRSSLSALALALAVTMGAAAAASTQEPPEGATPTAGVASPSKRCSLDPLLRKELDELVATVTSLKTLTDEELKTLDQRFVELAVRLSAVGKDSLAGRLTNEWGHLITTLRVRPIEALAVFDRAAACFSNQDKERLAEIAIGRGLAFHSLFRFKEALAEYDKGERVFEELGDGQTLADIAACRGHTLYALSRCTDALVEFDKAVRAYEALKVPSNLANLLLDRGLALGDLSRHAEALADFDKAERTFEGLGDAPGMARTAVSRGTIFLSLSRHEDARREYDKAARTFEERGDAAGLANIAVLRGAVFASQSRYEEAFAEYDKAKSGFEELGLDRGLADTAGNRGAALQSSSRYEEALREYDYAARFYEKHGIEARLASTAMNRGNVFNSLSRYEEALLEYAKAAEVFERLGVQGSLAKVALNRGNVLSSLSRYGEALAEYEKAAKVYEEIDDRRSLAVVSLNRGKVLASLSRHEEALAEFEAAARVFEDFGQEQSLASVAIGRATVFMSLARHEQALAEFEEAARVYEKLGDEEGLARIAMRRGSVFLSMARFDAALDQCAEAATRIERVLQSQVQKLGEASSSSFRDGFRSVVEDALTAAVSIGGLTDAQRERTYRVFGTFLGLGTAELIAERGRMPALALSDDEQRSFAALDVEIRETIAWRDRVTEARKKAGPRERESHDADLKLALERLQQLELEHSGSIERIRQRQQVAVGIQYPRASTSLEVQSELPADVALLEFCMGGDQLFAFVTTRTDQRLVSLGNAMPVIERVDQVRSAMTQPTLGQLDELQLRFLGEHLVSPLLAALPRASRITTLLVAAHGDLARLPFEILLIRDPDGPTNLAAVRPLVGLYDVAYVHSGTVMRAMKLDARRRVRSAGPDFVAFAFPSDAEGEIGGDAPELGLVLTDRSERLPLPGSATEVLSIAKQFAADADERRSIERALEGLEKDRSGAALQCIDGERFKLYLRADATESALKRDPSVRATRILHLACHAEADLVSPALSRLVLTPSKQIDAATSEDGYVYVRDLRDLGISAELLVLSACSTNAGTLHPLEGLTGLSRAGLAAGAEAVVSTFWRVDDVAASDLMIDFYRGWLHDGKTRIAALCAAKRKAIARGIPIRTWSAYALWDARTD